MSLPPRHETFLHSYRTTRLTSYGHNSGPCAQIQGVLASPADGNCYFASVNIAITGYPAGHLALRLRVALELILHWEGYQEHTTNAESPFADSLEFKDLREFILKPGGFVPGHLVAQATANVLGRPIWVLHPHKSPTFSTYRQLYSTKGEPTRRSAAGTEPVIILWTTTNPDSIQGTDTPSLNHFVPYIPHRPGDVILLEAPRETPDIQSSRAHTPINEGNQPPPQHQGRLQQHTTTSTDRNTTTQQQPLQPGIQRQPQRHEATAPNPEFSPHTQPNWGRRTYKQAVQNRPAPARQAQVQNTRPTSVPKHNTSNPTALSGPDNPPTNEHVRERERELTLSRGISDSPHGVTLRGLRITPCLSS